MEKQNLETRISKYRAKRLQQDGEAIIMRCRDDVKYMTYRGRIFILDGKWYKPFEPNIVYDESEYSDWVI